MNRILVWHLDPIRGADGSQGPVFYADHDYLPQAIRLYARVAPGGGSLKVDIRADGTSILTSEYATLNKGGNLEEHAEDYPATQSAIEEGSVISLHIIRTGDAEDVTCQLEMQSQSDEDDDSE